MVSICLFVNIYIKKKKKNTMPSDVFFQSYQEF